MKSGSDKVKIACIGNFPPRSCGIATFTSHLTGAICSGDGAPAAEAFIVAMNDQEYDYPADVRCTIRQDHQRDYLKAARFINYSDADVCLLEHEFGIFGGDDGVYILSLLHRLQIPLIVTLHTVLKDPSPGQKAVICELGRQAAKLVVMSRLAVEFLTGIYGVPREKIAVIEHGVPVFPPDRHEACRKKFNLDDKKILLTFGLLGRNKGIETVIEALPAVVEKHPDLIYVILGKTHPNVVKSQGEEYRTSLQRRVIDLHLENHVYFKDMFVSEEELCDYLSAADIYVTPYLHEAQITSGTLAYAVGSGAAVLSTPYWHARELLADGRGRLFDFRDSEQLSGILNELLDDPERLERLRCKAYEYGRGISWPVIGEQYRSLARRVREVPAVRTAGTEAPVVDPLVLPVFDLTHLRRMSDSTGLLQHATYSIPNRHHGYCLDDNARALLMISMADRQKKIPEAPELLPIYLSFIQYMQKEDGDFHNFLGYDRRYLDDCASRDAFGRTIWALGHLINHTPNDAWRQVAMDIFNRARPFFAAQGSLRGYADTMIGIAHYLRRFPDDTALREQLVSFAGALLDAYAAHGDEDWCWFEPTLTYDNGILPLALFHAYDVLGDEELLCVAEKTASFLDGIVFGDGCPCPVGSDGWYPRDGERARFAQQPVNIMALILMDRRAYAVTGSKQYVQRMFDSFRWFLGDNELGESLYDFESSGCCDGLEEYGLNRNQGAESLLAYLISHLCVLKASEDESIPRSGLL